MSVKPTYVNLFKLARETGLPAQWLKREADANRLPALRVGSRRMFDIDAVKQSLAERQTNGGER